jgi:hypothetical protein
MLLAEGQSDIYIDMTKLIVAFRRFAKAPMLATVCSKNHKKHFVKDMETFKLKQIVDTIFTEF